MRTVHEDAAVRLYHLDEDGALATTLFYGSLSDAMRVAAAQPEEVRAALFLQTADDVVSFLDLDTG